MMRAGVLGCGRMGQKRLRALAALGISDVHAYDPTQAGFDAALHLCAVAHPTLESLFEGGPDVVFICTPPETHVELARLAHAAWLTGLFIEKPLALTATGIDDLDAETWYGTVTQVGCNLRYVSGFQALRSCISEPVQTRLYAGYCLPDVRPDYRDSYVPGTGALFDAGWHMVDIALDWFGPATVTLSEVQPANEIELPKMDGAATLHLRHDSGSTSIISVTVMARPYRLGATMRWPDHSLALNYDRPPGEEMFLRETEAFIDCVREQKPSVNPIAKAKVTLGLLLEAKAKCSTG